MNFKRQGDWLGDDPHTINPQNGYSHYLIFTDHSRKMIQERYIDASSPVKSIAELVAKLKGTLVRLGPDALNLIDSQDPEQKARSQDEDPTTRGNTKKVPPEALSKLGFSPVAFALLHPAFMEPSQLWNIIKKLAQTKNPATMKEAIDKMFDTINPKTAEAMFNMMVHNNPVFSPEEKDQLKNAYKNAKTPEERKKLWQELTSGQAAKKSHSTKTKEEKDKIFEEQVNRNPAYGPPGEDTAERRERFKEYEKADPTKKAQMQEAENEKFTTGENANQWANYFQDNANRECGAGDESVGTESDNNFSGNFSFTDTLAAINKLKNLGSMKPKGMEEGMKSNKPYWEVIFLHPLTYIFIFIGLIVVVMATATRKNK